MTPEEIKKQKEEKQKAADAARGIADAAHQKAAENPGDEALQSAADEAEDAAIKLQGEADAIVVPSPGSDDPNEEQDDDEDIDFEKELKELEGIGKTPPANPPIQRTELEKAERALSFNAKRLKELGGDPDAIVKGIAPVDPPTPPANPPKQEDTSNFVSKDDYALEQARKLARSEAETKVIMHHYRHTIQRSGDVMKDIENAHLLANKGKITRSFEEIRRAGYSRPAPGGGGAGRGRRNVDTRVPQLSQSDQSTLRRRGYLPKADGSWEGKRYIVRYDPMKKDWVTDKK